MQSNDFARTSPSVGFIESSSIAKGVQAVDAMVKMARVEVLMTVVVARGKYLIMIGGAQAEVQQAMKAGLDTVGGSVVDQFLIQNIDPQVPAAIKGRVKVADIEAVGVVETKEVASAVFAADAAAKAAAVSIIEARYQPGGKGLLVLTGEVGAVRAAVNAAVATIKKDGMLISHVVIPYADKALLKVLTA